jgi:gamma-glutamyltranspeptidase / glutathione hydrolase
MAPIPRTNAGGDRKRRRGMPKILTGIHPWLRPGIRLAAPVVLGMLVTGCSMLDSINHTLFGGGPTPGQQGYVKGFLGEIVADEPRAALVGKEVLSGGGDAADAAVAVGLSLAVTLPSRAGLGGGGACIAYAPDTHLPAAGYPEAITFVSPPVRSVGGGDRPAAVPMLPRGLFFLHLRYGKLPFEFLLGKADALARQGVAVSTALSNDLSLVAGPLFADPAARAVFSLRGAPLVEGQTLVQPQLAATLAQLRVSGVGDFYQGVLARRIQQASPSAGVPIGLADLWSALPSLSSPVIVPLDDDQVAFPPTEGGVGAAAALVALKSQPGDAQAAFSRSLAAAARWRAGGANLDQTLHGELAAPAATPLYPASTTFATLDSEGNAVVCALSMNNLFGTGRMVPGFGFLAAASPATVTQPLLAPGLAWSGGRHAFHAAAGGSGQAGAALAAAVALSNSVHSGFPMTALVPEPGRANVIACSRYLPGSEQSCAAVADPRGAGLAVGGN